ncbi:MAG: cytochrome c oxidase subunit II [Bacteroidetes bacterium]|nr:cytochrome c oxidase subunit II [Bacteroidota bacterium]MCW5896971.1 cytochrome c oxidase subunit II [Bacteroidota bacterium]
MHDLLGLPIDASSHGHTIDEMIVIIHWLMLVLFVGWGGFFAYSLVRFRRARNPKADYVGVKSHTSSYIEVAVALFEGVLLVGFAIPVWSNVWLNYPDEKEALVVHVVAEQFAWNIHYPGKDGVFGRRDISLVTADNPLGLDRDDPDARDDIATINNMHIPVGKPILVYLTSKDVIHSFALPLLRVKQDAIPGQAIPITFMATMTLDEIRDQLKKNYSLTGGHLPENLSTLVATTDYNAGDGTPILAKGELLNEDAIAKLKEAGISSIEASQDTPVEIACAQLCGLGHYRMRGTLVLNTPEQFEAWLEEEAAYLE